MPPNSTCTLKSLIAQFLVWDVGMSSILLQHRHLDAEALGLLHQFKGLKADRLDTNTLLGEGRSA